MSNSTRLSFRTKKLNDINKDSEFTVFDHTIRLNTVFLDEMFRTNICDLLEYIFEITSWKAIEWQHLCVDMQTAYERTLKYKELNQILHTVDWYKDIYYSEMFLYCQVIIEAYEIYGNSIEFCLYHC